MKRPFLLSMLILLINWSTFAASNFGFSDTITVEIDSLVHNQCFGESEGKIYLGIQSDLPVTYAWSNGDSLQIIGGLVSGYYSVSVSDTTGYEVILDSIFIGQPDQLEVGITDVTRPDCNGTLGTLTIDAFGGTPSYAYLWSNGGTLITTDSLVAGLYEVSVTDGNDCQAVASFDLQPQYPAVSVASSGHINCLQSEVTLEGFISFNDNETYSWLAENNGHFSSSTDTLVVTVDSAGTFTLTVLDSLSGCSSTAVVVVELDIDTPLINAGTDTTVICSNTIVGLLAAASNGNSFSFSWEATNGGLILDGANTDSITVGASGQFILEVINIENGCISSDTVAVIGTNPTPTATVADNDLNCYFPIVNLQVAADTTDRTFQWNGPNGFTSNELSPLTNQGGTYVLLIVDTLTTCSTSLSLEVIDNTDSPIAIATGGTLTCTNTSVTLTVVTTSGDAVYDWTGPNGYSSSEQNPTISDAGDYILSLTDTLTGCSAIDTAYVAIDTLSPVVVISPVDILTCYTPTLSLNASGSVSGGSASLAWTTSGGNIVSGENTVSPLINAPGTYILTLTDNLNGCTAEGAIIVNGNFTTPIVDVIGGSFNCFDGGVQIFGQFDTIGVSFSWSGPNGYVSTVQNPFITKGGDYILTVTNTESGCAVSETAIVVQNGEIPILTVAVSDTITCNTPSVQLSVSSQIGGIDWSWAGPNNFASTEQDPMTNEAGWHFVLAIDSINGCIALDSVFVEIDTLHPIADAGTGLAFDCHTTSTILNGTASTGAGFNFVWSTTDGYFAAGENTLTPTVDSAGTFTLTVANQFNGCTSSSDVVISQTPAVVGEVNSIDVGCYGEATGSASVLPSGGVGGYSIAWSSGSTNSNATGLVAGNYSVSVTDADGCSTRQNVVIGQPDLLLPNASATGQSLSGIDDGTATANPSGGAAPYSFQWSNAEMTQTITDLVPGAYGVIITDNNGCSVLETVNVNEFPCLLASNISGTNLKCFDDNSGSATAVLENAILPYSFVWSNGDTTSTITALAAGIYNVVVNDSTLCKNELTIVISQPTPLAITELFHLNVDCPQEENGFVIVGANGGVQPYTYSWTNGDTTAVSNDLGIGAALLVLADANGCEAVFSTNITSNDAIAPQLVLQSISVSLDENGQIVLTGDQFDAGSVDNCGSVGFSVEPNSFDCSNLGIQTVTVLAYDQSGNSTSGTAIVEIVDDQAPVLTCPANTVVSLCNSVVSFDNPGVEDNCSVELSNLIQTDGLPSGSTYPIGDHTIVFAYTDVGGNSAACSFTVTVLESMQVSSFASNNSCANMCDGSIELSIISGVAPYQIDWSNGSTEAVLNNICSGIYTATIIDASGCMNIQTIEITEPAAIEIAVESIVNNDCANDLNGSISISLSGGSAAFTFLWSDGSTESNLENATSGIYSLVATDANGCEVSLTAEITAQDSIAPVLVLQNASIALDVDGLVTLNPALFDNGSFDNCSIASWAISPSAFDCESTGDQEVTITAIDSNGNSTTATAVVTIEDKTDPVLVCPSNKVVGFCNPQVSFSAPQITDNCAVILSNLQLVSGLSSGSTFPFGVTTQQYGYNDAAGNSAVCSFTVTVHAPANVTASVIDVACNGACDGQVILEIIGDASPFGITWSNSQTGPTATNLCAGDYNATVLDADGCLQFYSTVVTEPSALEVNVVDVINDTNMNGVGAIQINAVGGVTPYTYSWSKDGQPFSTNEDLTGLLSGAYQVLVFDANGCEIESETIIVQNLVPSFETNLSTDYKLSPNPATNWTKLTAAQPLAEITTVYLYDSIGKIARKYSVDKGQSDFQLDLNGIAPGFYTLKFNVKNGWVVKTLVIE